MTNQRIEDALRTLEEFKLTLSHFIPKTTEEELALEDACADAVRLAKRLREMRDEVMGHDVDV